jgi:galacturan 1,4-alpha-galacturonidase
LFLVNLAAPLSLSACHHFHSNPSPKQYLMKPPFALLLIAVSWLNFASAQRQVCELYPLGNGLDDAPNILQAFDNCGVNGTVVFTNNTFNINTVLNTTNLYNCHIHIYGTLRWSTNITYWTSLRFPILFESLSTGWLLGGKDVKVHGYGYGTIDGQGQVWYDWNKNKTNKPGRPMALTVYNSDNLIIRGLRIVQAQFWSMLISQSQNIVVTDMFINNVSNSTSTTVNTDGLDVWRSNNVTIQRWNVTCFDDAIAIKGNSSNVYVSDVNAYRTTGFAIGSIGQVKLCFFLT